jgi:hypothetical protein
MPTRLPVQPRRTGRRNCYLHLHLRHPSHPRWSHLVGFRTHTTLSRHMGWESWMTCLHQWLQAVVRSCLSPICSTSASHGCIRVLRQTSVSASYIITYTLCITSLHVTYHHMLVIPCSCHTCLNRVTVRARNNSVSTAVAFATPLSCHYLHHESTRL